MASIPIGQLESFDSGSNYNFNDKMLDAMNARAAFDMSFRTLGTTAEDGVLQTIAVLQTLPGDTWTINFNELLRSLPTVVPLESRKRQYIYAFWSRNGDLWNDWNTFAKKGYDGNLNLKVPVLENNKNCIEQFNTSAGSLRHFMKMRAAKTANSTWENEEALQATSMGENMGLPHNYTSETHTIDGSQVTLYANRSSFKKFVKGNTYAHEISALPFMQKLRIWRDYFVNKDYFINDRVILPHDDAEFRLDSNGELISAKNNNARLNIDFYTKQRDLTIGNYAGENGKIYTFGEPYHEFPKDRFTSAKPFLQRGTAPNLEYTINSNILKVHPGQGSGSSEFLADTINLTKPSNSSAGTWDSSSATAYTYAGVQLNNTNIQLDIKMADLRKLAIEQTELEKMARTDGSYAEFGLTFFKTISKNAYDFKPVYIGGTYKEIVFSEVVQTSESNNTPMGSYVGHSTSSHGDSIGSINCDDYGYIQIISCIMPDVIYSEGLADHWDQLYQKDIYLPERSKIGMTALLNKRLYFDYELSAAAETYNEGLFAYQNYGDCYRYHENEVHGSMAEGFNVEFLSYTQSRILGGQQNWGRNFALASNTNVRKDYLAAPDLPAFTYDIHLGIRAVREVPYKPIPANLTGL